MRKLAWTTCGFGIACLICAYFMPSWIWLPAIIAPIVGLLLLLGQKFFRFLRVITAVTVGFSLGVAWFILYDFFYLSDARQMDGGISSELLEVTDFSYETNYGYAVDVLYSRNGKTYRAVAYLNEDPHAEPGDTLQGVFQFRFTAFGGEKEPAYRRGGGIFLTMRQKGETVLHKSAWFPLIYYPRLINRNIQKLIESNFPADAASFAKGLLLGDRIDLSYEDYTAFRISGISHIVAVSGLHVGIVIAFLFFLTGRRKYLSCILGLPLLFLVAAIVGFRPSVNRACMMQALLLISMAAEREYDGITALSFSALVMMILNPMVVIDIGFQLSFASVMGIFLFASKIHDWFVSRKWMGAVKGKKIRFRLKRWLIGCVSVSVSASLTTTPLVAWYFGAVSLFGVVTNLLVLWVIPLIFYGAAAIVALAAVVGSLPQAVTFPVTLMIRYVLFAARLISKIPFAAIYTVNPYSVIWIVMAYILLFVFLLLPGRSVRALLLSLAVTLAACMGLARVEPMLDSCRMTMLDVGQGQCLLLSWDGRNYMVDCGGSYDMTAANVAAETLLSQGIHRIDGFILTHFDRDHWGGLPYFCSRIQVDALYCPDMPEAQDIRKDLERAAGVEAEIITDRTELATETGKLSLLPSGRHKTDNESCLAILFHHEKCDILITGDQNILGELLLVHNYNLPGMDVLVAGHHGSKNSTGEVLLNTVQPEIVLISVGKNYYNLPAPELLNRLQAHDCAVFRTDEYGTIVFRR